MEQKITEEFIKLIEKALGFELYEWQKSYLMNIRKNVFFGRRNGKTTAYILKLLLAEDEPIVISRESEWDKYVDYTIRSIGRNYRIWFIKELYRIKYQLDEMGIETREIIVDKGIPKPVQVHQGYKTKCVIFDELLEKEMKFSQKDLKVVEWTFDLLKGDKEQ